MKSNEYIRKGNKIYINNYMIDLNTAKYFLMFIGTPRSGHTLTASMINSHENAFLSNQKNFMDDIYNIDKEYIITTIKNRPERAFQKINMKVKAKKEIKLFGDKTGHMTAYHLLKDYNKLKEFKRTIDMPLKWIHVVRSPYDNITTWAVKNFNNYKKNRDENVWLSLSMKERGEIRDKRIEMAINKYIELQDVIEKVKRTEDVLTIYHEAQVNHTQETVREICSFLDLDIYDGYESNIKKVVWDTPHKTRNGIKWNKKRLNIIKQAIDRYSWLNRYKNTIKG